MTPPGFPKAPVSRKLIVTPELIEHHRRLAHDLRRAAIRRALKRGIRMARSLPRLWDKPANPTKESPPCNSTT